VLFGFVRSNGVCDSNNQVDKWFQLVAVADDCVDSKATKSFLTTPSFDCVNCSIGVHVWLVKLWLIKWYAVMCATNSTVTCQEIILLAFIKFRMRCSWGETYIGHGHLCVGVSVCVCICLSVPRRIPTLLHGPGCKLGNGMVGVSSSCAVLGRFAIGARVSLLWHHSTECKMSASACTHSVPGLSVCQLILALLAVCVY